jgi:uncharacterized FlaG/YvyC family protein
MVLDPIRPNDPIAVPNVAKAPPANSRSQPDARSQPIAHAVKPVPVSAPEPSHEVKVNWDGDNGVIVTFTDKKSGEVVRQIPSEQVLSVVRFIRQMLLDGESAGAKTGNSR